MLTKFIPKTYQKSIFQINYDKLKEKGIKLLIFDLDNTLSLIDETVPSAEVKNFINTLSKKFKILVASNNKEQRVKLFCKELDCDYIYSSLKPSKKICRFIKKHYSIEHNEVAIIGDQLVTDIFLGNRAKMYPILVDPKGEKDLKITSFNRFIENKIKNKIKFKKGVYYEED